MFKAHLHNFSKCLAYCQEFSNHMGSSLLIEKSEAMVICSILCDATFYLLRSFQSLGGCAFSHSLLVDNMLFYLKYILSLTSLEPRLAKKCLRAKCAYSDHLAHEQSITQAFALHSYILYYPVSHICVSGQ